jgi:Protein of unknown function (DUF2924)
MAKSNPVDETRIADPVERTKRQRRSNAEKAAGTAKAPKQQRRRKSAVGSRNGTKPASGRQSKQQTCLDLLGRREGATLGQQAVTRLIGPASPAELSQKLAALNDLTAPQLRAEWRRLYRGQPPRLSRDLLVRSIAYRIQELAHGGLSKATRRKLLALTKVLQSNGSIEPDDGPNLSPGARLVHIRSR